MLGYGRRILSSRQLAGKLKNGWGCKSDNMTPARWSWVCEPPAPPKNGVKRVDIRLDEFFANDGDIELVRNENCTY